MSSIDKKITLATAEEWTSEWRKKGSSYEKHHELKAFNIPIEDFKGVLKEPGVEAVRAYLGLEKKRNASGKVDFEEKLIIVGVDNNKKDMLPSGTPNKGSIYDFSRPCPNLCDFESPLNR